MVGELQIQNGGYEINLRKENSGETPRDDFTLKSLQVQIATEDVHKRLLSVDTPTGVDVVGNVLKYPRFTNRKRDRKRFRYVIRSRHSFHKLFKRRSKDHCNTHRFKLLFTKR